MSIGPEGPLPYVGLNNLDLLDESGTPNPYATGENFFDESPDDATLDELYADASYEELVSLTDEVFFERFNEFRAMLQARRDREAPYSLVPEDQKYNVDELVTRALPYLAHHIVKKHSLPTHEMSLLDRFQSGARYLAKAAGNYDATERATFIGMFMPQLERSIFQSEQGGSRIKTNQIAQGDLIRIPSTQRAYYRLKNFHRARNSRFDRELAVDELAALSDFTAAELEEYEDKRVEHVPFHSVEEAEWEAGVALSDAFIDTDPAIDPYEAAARRVAHYGITTALNLLTVAESEALVARTNLNRSSALTSYADAAEELGITRNAIGTSLYHGLKKLKDTSDIEKIIQEGTMNLQQPQAPEMKPAKGSLFACTIRDLLSDRTEGSVVKELKSKGGISFKKVLREAQLHPKYAIRKMKGDVFMDDSEAERLMGAVNIFSQQLGLSLYELAPTRSVELDVVFAMLEERETANA